MLVVAGKAFVVCLKGWDLDSELGSCLLDVAAEVNVLVQVENVV